MAGEIQFGGPGPGRSTYVLIHNRVGQVWSTSGGTGGFETYATVRYSDYGISATEQGSASNYYVATMPSAVPAGVYNIEAKQQLGGGVAETDPRVAVGQEQWNGTALFPLSDLVTSGQFGAIGPIRIAYGTMVQNFPFKLVSAADHVTPFVSGVVSGQISRNGGSFGALQSGNISEVGLGWYKVNLTSGDLQGNTIALVFTADGISGGTSDQRDFAIVTQKTSGG